MSQNNDYVEDYLMHHGVQGQKWGIRRMKEKAQKQKYKTQIADLKAMEAQSKKQEKEFKKSDKQIQKEHQKQTVQKGKNAATTALRVIGLATLSAVIVRKFVRGGKKASSV